MPSSVLILGARGRFGLAAAQAFRQAGWHVLGQMRPGATPPIDAPSEPPVETAQAAIEWLGLDLSDIGALARAGRSVSVVVHALNPGAYTVKAWGRDVLPMTDAAINMARTLDATLMVPGNVYNFGAGMPPLLREETPQNATAVKGRIRMAMEQRLRASGVKTVVIRAGDFFGSGKGSWFDLFVAKNIHKGRVTYPGHLNVPTAWAYLPDLARSFVAVAARRAELPPSDVPPFEVLHFAGHSLTGQQWLDALTSEAQAQGWVKPGAAVAFSRLPWPLLRLVALAHPTLASLMEMRYLWDTPHALVNNKLVALIGPEPRTPLDLAVRRSLAGLGMSPAQSARSSLIPA